MVYIRNVSIMVLSEIIFYLLQDGYIRVAGEALRIQVHIFHTGIVLEWL